MNSPGQCEVVGWGFGRGADLGSGKVRALRQATTGRKRPAEFEGDPAAGAAGRSPGGGGMADAGVFPCFWLPVEDPNPSTRSVRDLLEAPEGEPTRVIGTRRFALVVGLLETRCYVSLGRSHRAGIEGTLAVPLRTRRDS